jgi:hypothetical protein
MILVVTEGAVTEPEYLNGFVGANRNPRVRVEVVGGAGVPRTIVESARELKKDAEDRARAERDDNLRYEEVWCVFDIDQHLNVPNAKEMARDNDIHLAVSNPCFELWLLLHFADQPGIRHRWELCKMMERHIPNYDKHVDYHYYSNGYDSAARRARRLDDDAEADGDAGRNPTTGMWRLTESIRASA